MFKLKSLKKKYVLLDDTGASCFIDSFTESTINDAIKTTKTQLK